jgi:hypothetical protein
MTARETPTAAVFIGRNLDGDELRRDVSACLADS